MLKRLQQLEADQQALNRELDLAFVLVLVLVLIPTLSGVALIA